MAKTYRITEEQYRYILENMYTGSRDGDVPELNDGGEVSVETPGFNPGTDNYEDLSNQNFYRGSRVGLGLSSGLGMVRERSERGRRTR